MLLKPSASTIFSIFHLHLAGNNAPNIQQNAWHFADVQSMLTGRVGYMGRRQPNLIFSTNTNLHIYRVLNRSLKSWARA